MRSSGSDVVVIVRQFLEAQRRLREVALRFRAGVLRFDDVAALVGEGEEAVLYRLKEHCHALFRGGLVRDPADIGPELLFDLAVGSLFHEAMKFRENFYQRDVYGPRVRALREAGVPDAAGLLKEFEKILAGGDARLEESLQEAEALLAQTVAQFRALLVARAAGGLVTRYLIENEALVEEALGEPLDRTLAAMHGDAAAGLVAAARSYLGSGFFGQAQIALAGAARRGARDGETLRLGAYAAGMQAYLDSRYDQVVERLREWLDAGGPGPDEQRLTRLALAAVSRVGQLAGCAAGATLGPPAAALAERLRQSLPAAQPPGRGSA